MSQATTVFCHFKPWSWDVLNQCSQQEDFKWKHLSGGRKTFLPFPSLPLGSAKARGERNMFDIQCFVWSIKWQPFDLASGNRPQRVLNLGENLLLNLKLFETVWRTDAWLKNLGGRGVLGFYHLAHMHIYIWYIYVEVLYVERSLMEFYNSTRYIFLL